MTERAFILHQSDFASWNRCPAETAYSWSAIRSDANSASAFGSVVHHALQVLERYRDLDKAIDTFLYYWHPLNIEQITEPVPTDGWLPRQDYNTLRQRGVAMLRRYAELTQYDDHEVLALEYDFVVPLRGTPHYLAGTVDRLAVRWHRKLETLCIDDFKTGKQRWNLRQNLQGTIYSYATLQPEFWTGATVTAERPLQGQKSYASEGFDNERAATLIERFGLWEAARAGGFDAVSPRLFTWINTKEMRWVNGGYRGEQDYARMAMAVEEMARACDARIFTFNISGETCTFCDFRNICGGEGLPEDDHGAPWRYGQ